MADAVVMMVAVVVERVVSMSCHQGKGREMGLGRVRKEEEETNKLGLLLFVVSEGTGTWHGTQKGKTNVYICRDVVQTYMIFGSMMIREFVVMSV